MANQRQRRDHEIPDHPLALPPYSAGKLLELVVGRTRHAQKVVPRLGRRIAASVALKELGPKPRFQGVDVADHGRMMHTQDIGRATDGPLLGDLIGGSDFVPVFQSDLLCGDSHLQPKVSLSVRQRKKLVGGLVNLARVLRRET